MEESLDRLKRTLREEVQKAEIAIDKQRDATTEAKLANQEERESIDAERESAAAERSNLENQRREILERWQYLSEQMEEVSRLREEVEAEKKELQRRSQTWFGACMCPAPDRSGEITTSGAGADKASGSATQHASHNDPAPNPYETYENNGYQSQVQTRLDLADTNH